MTSNLERAEAFALRVHAAQRYGGQPYDVHLRAVVSLLAGQPEAVRVAGWLHDAVEDTPTTAEELRAAFGDDVARWVALVTDATGTHRAERKQLTNAKLAAIDHEGPDAPALIIKTADRLANVTASVVRGPAHKAAMYRREHPAFREAVFRPGLCDSLWAELDRLIRR